MFYGMHLQGSFVVLCDWSCFWENCWRIQPLFTVIINSAVLGMHSYNSLVKSSVLVDWPDLKLSVNTICTWLQFGILMLMLSFLTGKLICFLMEQCNKFVISRVVTIFNIHFLLDAENENYIWSADICFKSRETRSQDESSPGFFKTWQCGCYQVYPHLLSFN